MQAHDAMRRVIERLETLKPGDERRECLLVLARLITQSSRSAVSYGESLGARAPLTRALNWGMMNSDEELMDACGAALGRCAEPAVKTVAVELKSVPGSQIGQAAARKQGVLEIALPVSLSTIRVHESSWDDAGLAWRVWGASQILGRAIDAAPELTRGKSCLEIGSGCGFTALVAARAGASRVVISEGAPGALRAIRHSIADLLPEESARTSAAFLDFRDDEDILNGVVSLDEARTGEARHWVHNRKADAKLETTDNRVSVEDVFDVVLATDVIYTEEHVSPLAACLARRVAQTGTGYVMNACRHAGLLTHFITSVISHGMHVQVSAIERFEGEDLAECQGGHLHRDLPEHTEQWWCESAIKLAKFDECIIVNDVSSTTYDAVAMEALITTLEGRFVLLKLSHAT